MVFIKAIKELKQINEKNNKNGLEQSNTLLMRVSASGQILATLKLINKGVSINEKNKYDKTALYMALERRHYVVAKLLIEKEAVIDYSTNLYNFYKWALQKEYIKIIYKIIQYYKTVNNLKSSLLRSIIGEKNSNNNTILMIASKKGSHQIVKYILDNIIKEKNSYINQQNIKGDTALMLATDKGSVEIAKLLIDFGANISKKNNDNNTALIIATNKELIEIVKLFLLNSKNIINKFKKYNIIINSLSKNISKEICGICLMRETDIMTHCDHSYCSSCYLNYYYITNHPKQCAFCRKKLDNEVTYY